MINNRGVVLSSLGCNKLEILIRGALTPSLDVIIIGLIVTLDESHSVPSRYCVWHSSGRVLSVEKHSTRSGGPFDSS